MEGYYNQETLNRQNELKERLPIVIGALGTISDETLDDLNKLKLQTQRDALQMTVATGSANILNAHFKLEDFTT